SVPTSTSFTYTFANGTALPNASGGTVAVVPPVTQKDSTGTTNNSIVASPNGATSVVNNGVVSVTINTNLPHGLTVGQPVFVAGVGGAAAGVNYNSPISSPFIVTSVPSPTSFTYNVAGAAAFAASGAGSITTSFPTITSISNGGTTTNTVTTNVP